MNKKTITLGGQSYLLMELPARKNAAWRRLLEEKAQPLLGLIEQASAGVEITNSEDLMRLVQLALPTLLHAPEILFELITAYAPMISDDLLDNAYDSEVVGAFLGVLSLAFPFGGLIQELTSLASGSAPTASRRTSMNSPSLNGVSPSPMPSTTMGA